MKKCKIITFYRQFWHFPLIAPSDIVRIKELTLILKIISQCEVQHIMMLPIKTITLVFKVSTNIITSIAGHHIGLALVLMIISYLLTSGNC